MNPPVALVIDDEVQIRRLLRLVLETKGYKVHEADAGQIGLAQVAFCRPDVVLLDLGLPDLDGLSVLRRLREWTTVPVLVLSVRDEEAIKVEALESGADDYVTKPFGTAELLARLKAIQRRTEALNSPECSLGPLHIDFAQREVTLAGTPVKLTPTEYAVLRVLAQHAGRVVTHGQIIRQVWGPSLDEQSQSLRVYVNHLRNKIAPPETGIKIRNEPGIGYRLLAVETA